MAGNNNHDKKDQILLSKVRAMLAFFPDIDADEAISIADSIPRGGVTPEEVAAVEAFHGNGDLNQLTNLLGYEGAGRHQKALKTVERVEKYQKNLEAQNAYDEDPGNAAAPAVAEAGEANVGAAVNAVAPVGAEAAPAAE